ncbi:MAG: hypothetical protein ACE5H9_17340 [Anaerolineae bacterium]
MRKFGRLLIALFIFLSGAALVPYVSLPEEEFSWVLYADAYSVDDEFIVYLPLVAKSSP